MVSGTLRKRKPQQHMTALLLSVREVKPEYFIRPLITDIK
jgi:hypothetical protein